MEVGLLACLLALAVDLAIGIADGEQSRTWPLAVVLSLMTLVRADAILPAMLVGAAATASVPRERRRAAFMSCVAAALVLVGHTVGRWLYYGSPLPNTYYLKMTGVPAAVRMARGWAVTKGAARYMVLPILLTAVNRRVYRTAATATLVAVPVLLSVYNVYVDGDAWEWMPHTNRYLTPALPHHRAGASATLATAAERAARRAALPLSLAGALLLIAVVSGPGFADWMRGRGSHVVDDANMVWIGVRVRQTTAPSTRIGVVWAGAIPYFSHRPAVDFLGKSDPVIARHAPVTVFDRPGHDRFDYEYSIGTLKPDLVVQLWAPPANLMTRLADWGYVQVYGGVFVTRGADVDAARLRAAFNEPPIS